jgi:hypothetical protein
MWICALVVLERFKGLIPLELRMRNLAARSVMPLSEIAQVVALLAASASLPWIVGFAVWWLR